MPLYKTDYSKTIIYKICCNDLNITDIYIGHTTDFKTRKNHHKSDCNNINNKGYKYYVYEFIRNNGGWDNWTMVMIEEYQCNNKLEASKRERELIEELKATLNKVIPTRTGKEYYIDNKEIILNKFKEYRTEYHKLKYEKNKEEINSRRKEKIECECGFMSCRANLYRHQKTKKHFDDLNIKNV